MKSSSSRNGRMIPVDQKVTFTMAGHAHLDPVWLWDRQEGAETVKATFRSALDRMQENPDLVFVQSSAAQYSWLEIHPPLLAEIRAAVDRGQWEPVGGWWVEPDVNIPSGEALARQGLYGQRYYERTLGRRANVAFLPDSFGHPVTLPQILRQCGLDYFLFWRPVGPEIDLPSNLFEWEGPDGTRILSARIETYNSSPNQVVDTLNASIDWRPAAAPEWIVVYGVGNHGGGPTKKAIASLRELMDHPDWPTLQMGSLQGFFERAAERSRGRAYPVWREGLQYSFRGCYTSHSLIKKLNRRAEQALVTAEKWSLIAGQFGLPYPAEALERAWKHLLFNQFHDILAGTAIASAYEDARNELGEAIGTGRRVLHAAQQVIASAIDTRSGDHPVAEAMRRVRTGAGNAVADLGDGVPVVVFNPSPWPRREVIDVEVNDWHIADMRVLDDENRPVVHQFAHPEANPPRKRAAFLAEVPPMGYRVYRLVDEPPCTSPPLQADQRVMENRWWRLELDPRTGALRSLRDKERNLELLSGAGAQLLVMDDPDNPWGVGDSFRHLIGPFAEPVVDLIEAGPVRATWRITTRFGGSVARQEITLFGGIPAIHGRLEIDWHEQYKTVKLAFPFALQDASATYSVPFGAVARPADGREEPLQQWLDVAGRLGGQPYGVALLNDCKYGADVLGGEARLSILRSPVHAGGNRGEYPLGPNQRYLDQGLQELRWALAPHAGAWQEAGVVQAAQDFNEPLTFVREFAHGGALPKCHSFLAVEPPDAVVVSALKRAEAGDDWILRLYEPHGRTVEAEVGIPALGVKVPVTAGPYQVKTYRIGAGSGAVWEVNFLEE